MPGKPPPTPKKSPAPPGGFKGTWRDKGMGPVTMLPEEAGGKGSKLGRGETGRVFPRLSLSLFFSTTAHS